MGWRLLVLWTAGAEQLAHIQWGDSATQECWKLLSLGSRLTRHALLVLAPGNWGYIGHFGAAGGLWPQRFEIPWFSDVFTSNNFRVYMRLKWYKQVGLSVFKGVIIFPRVKLWWHYLQWWYLDSFFYLWVLNVWQVFCWFSGCYIMYLLVNGVPWLHCPKLFCVISNIN